MKVLIAAGGTGGHIVPAVSLANVLKKQKPESRIVFFGSSNRMEATVIPEAGYPFYGVQMSGMNSGIKAIMLIKKPKKGFIKRTADVNNDSFVKKLSVFKNRTRDVYVKVYPKNGTTGTYTITWK